MVKKYAMMVQAALLSVTLAVTGCVPGLAATLASTAATVSQVTAVLTGINAVAQEFFVRFPDVPVGTRDGYLKAYSGVTTALAEYQRIAEASEDLEAGKTLEAFAKFQTAYDNLITWLNENGLRNGQGQLMLQGQVISELPPAASFKR